MIYYLLSVLMFAGIIEVLIITTLKISWIFNVYWVMAQSWVCLKYIVQPSPDGLDQAFILGEDFIVDDDVCLGLGDNVNYGHDLTGLLTTGVQNAQSEKKATVFGYHVYDPQQYGVAEFDDKGNVISNEEKPDKPKSNCAGTGLYFYPNDVIQKAKKITPFYRGELEITSVYHAYLAEQRLKVELMGRGYVW